MASHAGRDGRRSLETIVVMSEHADGRGAVHLTADQALYVQSRLSQIAVTFLLTIVQRVHPHRQATTHPDGPAVHTLASCGAEAWPVVGEGAVIPPDLEKVVVEATARTGERRFTSRPSKRSTSRSA